MLNPSPRSHPIGPTRIEFRPSSPVTRASHPDHVPSPGGHLYCPGPGLSDNFVNDASPDSSTEQIRALSEQDSRVIGIVHSRNFGSQAAFRSGMEISGKEACVLLDGDLQDPPEIIPAFVEKWRDGADVVYGRRVRRKCRGGLKDVQRILFNFLSA